MKLPPLEINQVTGEAIIPAAWRTIIERCCELKEAIDHASRWPESTPWRHTVQAILSEHGLSIDDVPHHAAVGGNLPDKFALMLGGSRIFGLRDRPHTQRETSIVPAWATLGWVRKEAYANTPKMEADERLKAANTLPTDASSYVVEGIPLFMASEGKNRTQLQRYANTTRQAHLTVLGHRDYSHLRARPLAFAPGIVVLEDGDKYELLPFRSVSEDLLRAIGVKWSNSPSLKPWLGDAWCAGKPWRKGSSEKRIRVSLLSR